MDCRDCRSVGSAKFKALAREHRCGKLLGRDRAEHVAQIVFEEYLIAPHYSDLGQYKWLLRRRIYNRIRKSRKVGFPWVTLALLLAEVLIKLIIMRWENR